MERYDSQNKDKRHVTFLDNIIDEKEARQSHAKIYLNTAQSCCELKNLSAFFRACVMFSNGGARTDLFGRVALPVYLGMCIWATSKSFVILRAQRA